MWRGFTNSGGLSMVIAESRMTMRGVPGAPLSDYRVWRDLDVLRCYEMACGNEHRHSLHVWETYVTRLSNSA